MKKQSTSVEIHQIEQTSLFNLKSNRPYIQPESHDLVKTHKYKGVCDSVLYNQIQSPLCDYLVTFFPKWLAPNTVTFMGFAINIVTFVGMLALYGKDNEGFMPGWFAIWMGVAQCIYATLDNCDGKQARRTGSSSPMGMLFDHGCDASVAVINNIMIQRLCQVGNTNEAVLSMMASTVPFYYITLEQFYVGVLYLPAFNGPDDVHLVYSLACFYTAYIGSQDLWMQEHEFFGMEKRRICHYLVYLIVIAELFSVVNVFIGMYQARNEEHFKKTFTWKSFISHQIYMPIVCCMFVLYFYIPGSQIIESQPRLVQIAYGGLFLNATLLCQFSEVTKVIFNPFRRTVVLSLLLMLVNIVGFAIYQKPLINELALYGIIVTLVWGAISHRIYYQLFEMKTILNTYIFSIKQPSIKQD